MPRIAFKKSEHAPVDLHEAVIVGRSEQHANVVVKDNRLSRAHCKFEPKDGGWMVSDMDSQNGTFVNGRRIKEAPVKGGDIITIGACDMVFEGAAKADDKGKPISAGFSAIKDVHSASDNPDSTRTVVAPAALVLTKGTLAEKIHPITQELFNIGRRPDNQLVIDGDPKVSSHHARIRRQGMLYLLEDLNSMNGVVVNGHAITQPVSLRPGNVVIIGLQTFEFQLQGRPNVSSGETAPILQREAVKAQLESGLIEGLEESAQMQALPADAAGETALHDKAAMTQKVARVSGGAIFGALEVLFVLAIAAGVLYAGFVMTREGTGDGGEVEGSGPAARDGALFTLNPSFDEKDEGGFAKGWRYEVAGTDSFALVEGARGGPFALQVARYSPANAVSYAIGAPIDVKGARGVKASVFAMNRVYEVARFGTAVLALVWFEHSRDRDPILGTPLAV
jgi:pSer/pThr/pTyr-binding forkhead associated (FHA) protein